MDLTFASLLKPLLRFRHFIIMKSLENRKNENYQEKESSVCMLRSNAMPAQAILSTK